jgi:hypothetical protein
MTWELLLALVVFAVVGAVALAYARSRKPGGS